MKVNPILLFFTGLLWSASGYEAAGRTEEKAREHNSIQPLPLSFLLPLFFILQLLTTITILFLDDITSSLPSLLSSFSNSS